MQMSVHPLSAAVIAALFSSSVFAADTHVDSHHFENGTIMQVTSCADDGTPGTLRSTIAAAATGDTVDLSKLTCGSITLAEGAIDISQVSLTIQGPGARQLAIDGNNVDRIFNQLAGTLYVNDITLENGATSGVDALGGCVRTGGSLYFVRSTATGCTALGTASARGGALAASDISLTNSRVSDSSARASDQNGTVMGGGIFAEDYLALNGSIVSHNGADAAQGIVHGGGASFYRGTVRFSTISGNSVSGDLAYPYHIGGGLDAGYSATIENSTVDNNAATYGGGVFCGAGGFLEIANTTISSNMGVAASGVSSWSTIRMRNSTVAFNQSGGVSLSNVPAYFQSSILAMNASGPFGDLSTGSKDITGSNNIIRVHPNVTVPAGTLSADPQLEPFANNGGATRTHALKSTSAAIDSGILTQDYATDQRGGAFKRVVGAGPDIGAFEWEDDHIFGAGFD